MMIDEKNWRLNFRCSNDILNNAFDFFESGVTNLAKNQSWFGHFDQSELKSSLLSITTSVELILKAKIAFFDYNLILKNANKISTERLSQGEFDSISFSTCVSIIENKININLTTNLKASIETIRKERNKLAHSHSKETTERFLGIAAKGIDVFIEFYREHIKESFCEEKDRTVKLEQKLFDIKAYVNIRLETIKPKLVLYQRPKTYYFIECSNCYQDAAILKSNDTVKCLFCEDEYKVEDYAELCSNFNHQTKECLHCKIRSMIAVHKDTNEDEGWDCIVCGYFINRPEQWSIEDGKASLSSIRVDL